MMIFPLTRDYKRRKRVKVEGLEKLGSERQRVETLGNTREGGETR